MNFLLDTINSSLRKKTSLGNRFKLKHDESFFISPMFQSQHAAVICFFPRNVEPFASNVKSAEHLKCANHNDIEYIKRHSNIQ